MMIDTPSSSSFFPLLSKLGSFGPREGGKLCLNERLPMAKRMRMHERNKYFIVRVPSEVSKKI